MVLSLPTTESQIVSYDYNDLSDGTGIIKFNGFKVAVSGSTVYGLNTESFDSDTPYTDSSAIPQTTETKVLDLDFDLPFSLPKDVKGKMFINIASLLTGTDDDTHYWWIIKIRKYDGTTETEITSVNSSPILVTDPSANYYKNWTAVVTLPLTHFKKDEILRVTIEGWGYKDAETGNVYLYLYHDPMNTTVAGLSYTYLKVMVPFRLEL